MSVLFMCVVTITDFLLPSGVCRDTKVIRLVQFRCCLRGSSDLFDKMKTGKGQSGDHVSVKVNESVKGLTIHHSFNCKKTLESYAGRLDL